MTYGNGLEPGYLSPGDCHLADLIDVVREKTDPADYPHASGPSRVC